MFQPDNNTWHDRLGLLRISLQFFAEGDGEDVGEDGGSVDVESGEPAGDTQGDDTTTPGGEGDFYDSLSEADRNAFLKKHGLMHHSAAKSRYQGSLDKAAKYDALSSHFGAVAERYGVSMDNPEALVNAILNDPARVRAKAAEVGCSEDVAKSLVAADATEAIRKAQMAERVRREALARIEAQEAEVKETYPTFNMAKVEKNPAFAALYNSGKFTMKQAYEMAFSSELAKASIEAARSEARASALAEYRANGGRPVEGAASQAGNASADPGALKGKELDDFLASFLTR